MTSNKINRVPTGTSSNILFSCSSRSEKVCFLRNVTTIFTTIASRNATYFWNFFHCTVNLLLPLSCLLPNKTLWNCVSESQICCSDVVACLSLSVWLNMYRILICRFHMTIFVDAVWKFSLFLWRYILEPAEVFHIIFPL